MRRYIDAWESVDIPGLVALMREDAVMTMPPDPAVFLGRQEIGGFFATVPAGGALGAFAAGRRRNEPDQAAMRSGSTIRG